MNHALIYTDGTTNLTFNVDWPDFASFMPPPEIVLTDDDGGEHRYHFKALV